MRHAPGRVSRPMPERHKPSALLSRASYSRSRAVAEPDRSFPKPSSPGTPYGRSLIYRPHDQPEITFTNTEDFNTLGARWLPDLLRTRAPFSQG